MITNIQEITLAPVVRSSANAKMNIDEVIGNLKHKAFLSRSAVSSHQKLSAVQQTYYRDRMRMDKPSPRFG